MQDQTVVMARIRKLLALAGNNPNEAEALAAATKAQELMEAYGLQFVNLTEAEKAKTADRHDKKMQGGLYKWQRRLWANVARLHYCMFWEELGLTKGSRYQMRILGRDVNVLSAELMAEYLQGTIERHARERVNNDGREFFTKENIAFREGMADRLCNRLQQRRWQLEDEARKKQAEEEKRRQHPAYANTANALTILDVALTEQELNDDYLYGAGYSAQRREQRAKWQAEAAARRAAQEQWERDHPEEAAAAKAEAARVEAAWRAREERLARRRKGRTYKEEVKPYSYYEGLQAGEKVSLDPQVSNQQKKAIG